MITATSQRDRSLRSKLERLTSCDKDFWSFKGRSRREHGHAFFQYPAMMVPQMARAVLREACTVHPEIEWVGDPFAGSGTILTESMLQGLSFAGSDINPLAILLCKTKAGPFYPGALSEKVADLKLRIAHDRQNAVDVSFPGLDKWFRQDVRVALSRIRRAVKAEPARWARRFFWIALAETVRLTSNSRTSTFKLHIRPREEMAARTIDPVAVFSRAVDRNAVHLKTQTAYLRQKGLLSKGHYSGRVEIALADSRTVAHGRGVLCDIIITSPPYGDNHSTVPYGQYSYLPLQWIDLPDIDPSAGTECLASTHEIDSRSLGGSRRLEQRVQQSLARRSPSLRRLLSRLRDQPDDRPKRVTAFFRDLDECLETIVRSVRPGGLLVWTLGNRKVGGRRVPLDTILSELLESRNVTMLSKLRRRISSKRMPFKNSIADTMRSEAILVMRKAQ